MIICNNIDIWCACMEPDGFGVELAGLVPKTSLFTSRWLIFQWWVLVRGWKMRFSERPIQSHVDQSKCLAGPSQKTGLAAKWHVPQLWCLWLFLAGGFPSWFLKDMARSRCLWNSNHWLRLYSWYNLNMRVGPSSTGTKVLSHHQGSWRCIAVGEGKGLGRLLDWL